MANNKKTITIFAIVALIVLAIVILVTIVAGLTGASIVLVTLFIILTISLAIYLKDSPDELSVFIREKKRILRTYDSVIVEVEDIPNIAGKNIIKVKTIGDLVDAQLELREPIYYKNDNDSCFFLLLHYNEACIYILKLNDTVISPTEQSIKYMKPDKKEEKKESNQNILENVENTIVYKLDEMRSFKISPVRNDHKIEVTDDEGLKTQVLFNKESVNTITSDKLTDEISKTKYIENLKEKVAALEKEEEEKKKNEEVNKAVVKEVAEVKVKVKKATPKKKPAPKKRIIPDTHNAKRAASYKSKKK